MQLSFFGITCFIALAACGGTTESPGAIGAAATEDAGTSPAPSSSASPSKEVDAAAPAPKPTPTPVPKGACNALADDGPVASAQMVAADAPLATGGVIASGKYHLVDLTLYTGTAGTNAPLAVSVTTTMKVQGNSVQAATSGPSGAKNVTASFATSAAQITWTELCPVKGGSSGTYSVGPSELTIFMANDLKQIAASKYVLAH